LTYYTPKHQPQDTDILVAFRVTPQPGVPSAEVGAAIAVESSTGTLITVWIDRLTSLDRYEGRCYHIDGLSKARHTVSKLRDKLNKYDRPLLGCTIKSKLGLSDKNYSL